MSHEIYWDDWVYALLSSKERDFCPETQPGNPLELARYAARHARVTRNNCRRWSVTVLTRKLCGRSSQGTLGFKGTELEHVRALFSQHRMPCRQTFTETAKEDAGDAEAAEPGRATQQGGQAKVGSADLHCGPDTEPPGGAAQAEGCRQGGQGQGAGGGDQATFPQGEERLIIPLISEMASLQAVPPTATTEPDWTWALLTKFFKYFVAET